MLHGTRNVLACILVLATAASVGWTQSRPQDLSAISLEQLINTEVTTVSRIPEKRFRVPAAVYVITQEDIRRSGATTFPELFRMVPGMSVARIDNNKWAINARGFNDRFANRLLVQVDGRAVYNPLFSGVYWDTVDYPLEDIERIEVIRGPAASVWGANAVNGVVNIITKPAKDTQGGLFSGGGGTEERGFGTFHYGGQLGKDLSFRVYEKGFHREEQFSAQGDPNDGWWGTSAGLRLDWQASERDAVTFDGGYVRSVAGRNDLRPMPTAPFAFLNLENEVTDGGHVLARWSHQLGHENSWSLQTYWDRATRVSDNGYFDLRWDTYDVDFQHQFPLGNRQKMVYGAGYRYIDAFLGPSTRDNGFAVSFPPPHRHPQLFSGFVEDQIALLGEDHLSLTLGSKFEHNDHTGFEVQPTTRLLWTPTKRQTVWVAVSRAVRTPNLSEDAVGITLLSAVIGPPSTLFPRQRGNTDFKSEELLAYELGYRAQVTDNFSMDVATFRNIYHRLRVSLAGAVEPGPVAGTFILPLKFQNGMNGETAGAELAINWQLIHWWKLYGTYTFLDMELHADQGVPTSAEAAEDQSPRHQAYLQSSWDLPHNVEFDLMGRLVDKVRGFNLSGAAGVADKVNAYLSLDSRLSWRPRKNLEITVVGQSLLDPHHPEFGTNAFLKAPLVELKRGVYSTVTWKW